MGSRCLLLTLVLLPAIALAQPPADLVLINGNVATMNEARPRAEAVAVRGRRIVLVGTTEDVRKLIGDKTRVVDAKERFVMPGFIEGHGHFVSLGYAKMQLDLTKASDWTEIVKQVEAAAKKVPAGTWVVGRGWHQAKWTSPPKVNVHGYPVHASLSRVTPRHPVMLTHASGHMSFGNAEAMRLAGVTNRTRDPAGGEIGRHKDGRATGVFRETAQSLISRALVRSESNLSVEEARKRFQRAIELAGKDCLSKGVTSFQDAGSSFNNIRFFRSYAEKGKLPVRLWVMVRDSNARLARDLSRYRMVGHGDNFLTVRAIKRSIDGALGAHGAWLLEPYDDLPRSAGLNTSSIASIRQTARLALQHDYQLCVHAIGDRANRATMDLFAEAFRSVSDGAARRWRIEHAQHLNSTDIPRFAKLGVIASMQGIHCTSDAVFVIQRLGQRRAKTGAYVWRSLLDAGAKVINGTDAPVEDVDPLASFYASVTRRTKSGVAFYPEQCMTRLEALRSYTIDAAYAAFEADLKGSLEAGKLADLVIVSHDLLKCSDEELLKAKVEQTVLDGKIVFDRHAGEAR